MTILDMRTKITFHGCNYGEFLKDKNVFLCTRLYKYARNLESLLTQQYVCVMCTLWSDNTCVFTRFHSVKNANTQLIWSSVLLDVWFDFWNVSALLSRGWVYGGDIRVVPTHLVF